MKRRRFLAAAILLSACAAPGCGSDTKPVATIRLGATHTLRDTGLLDVLVPAFEKETGIRVQTLVGGTGEVLKKAERGDSDVVIVHARKAEDAFLAKGFGVERQDVWWNRFLIVGPSDEAGFAIWVESHLSNMARAHPVVGHEGPGSKAATGDDAHVADPAEELRHALLTSSAARAMRAIRERSHSFVSRGDDSGTHKREIELWGKDFRRWPGYVETGSGMAATLKVADEKNAYTLTDEGTFLKMRKSLRLRALVADGPALVNSYGALLVKPDPARPGDHAPAKKLVEWLTGEHCRSLVKAFLVDGERAFFLPGEQPPASGG